MILLKSNAENIFWFGRYLARTQYLCSKFPFQADDEALQYASAFCLEAEDAESLNQLVLDPTQSCSLVQLFQYAKDNIHDLRAVLSAKAYAELNALIRTANQNSHYICDIASDCQDVLETEAEDIFLFFSFGQMVEKFDRDLRLNQDTEDTMRSLDFIVRALQEKGWLGLEHSWSDLKFLPNQMNFYQFSDRIHQLFESNV